MTDDQMIAFMKLAVGRLGADELLTTREIVRDFLDLLHTLHQHPDTSFDILLGDRTIQPAAANPDEVDDLLAEFEL